ESIPLVQLRRLKVTCLVSANLGATIVEIRDRHGEVLGAPAPVPAVEEDRASGSLRCPTEVWLQASGHQIPYALPGDTSVIAQHSLTGGVTCPSPRVSYATRQDPEQLEASRIGFLLGERGEQFI